MSCFCNYTVSMRFTPVAVYASGSVPLGKWYGDILLYEYGVTFINSINS